MLTIEQIRRKLADGGYRLSDHALARVVERDVAPDMIRHAGANAEMIEDYAQDKYGPGCLLLGIASDGTPLHLHGSRADAEEV